MVLFDGLELLFEEFLLFELFLFLFLFEDDLTVGGDYFVDVLGLCALRDLAPSDVSSLWV